MRNAKVMKLKKADTIQFTFRAPVTDMKKLKELVGPFGKVAGLVRHLIKEHLQKKEQEAA